MGIRRPGTKGYEEVDGVVNCRYIKFDFLNDNNLKVINCIKKF